MPPANRRFEMVDGRLGNAIGRGHPCLGSTPVSGVCQPDSDFWRPAKTIFKIREHETASVRAGLAYTRDACVTRIRLCASHQLQIAIAGNSAYETFPDVRHDRLVDRHRHNAWSGDRGFIRRDYANVRYSSRRALLLLSLSAHYI